METLKPKRVLCPVCGGLVTEEYRGKFKGVKQVGWDGPYVPVHAPHVTDKNKHRFPDKGAKCPASGRKI